MAKKKFTIREILMAIFLLVAIFLAIATCLKLFKETDSFSKQNEELINIQKSIILDNDKNKILLGYPKNEIDSKYQITANYDNKNNRWIINIKSQKFLEFQEYTKSIDANGEYTGYFKYFIQQKYNNKLLNKMTLIFIVLVGCYYFIFAIITSIVIKIIEIRKNKKVICN